MFHRIEHLIKDSRNISVEKATGARLGRPGSRDLAASTIENPPVLGYLELKPFAADFWPRFWRAYSYLSANGLMRLK